MKDELLQASLAYFQSMPVFCRLLKGFCEKYRSFGSFRGSVQLSLRNEEEREALEGFFGRSYRNQKTASISAAAFQKALRETRFAAVSPEALLESFHGAPLIGKREAALQHREMVQRCWQNAIAAQEKQPHCPASQRLLQSLSLMSSAQDADAAAVVDAAQAVEPATAANAGGTANAGSAANADAAVNAVSVANAVPAELRALVHQMMNGRQELPEDPLLASLHRQLAFLLRALELLTELRQRSDYQYLPVFAAALTGDPHALDPGSENAHLFSLLLQWIRTNEEISAREESPAVTEEATALKRQSLYFSAGILLDDVSNYAMLCGVEAERTDGQRHGGMAGFAAAGEPVNVPLSVLAKWQHIRCRDNTLWIVENPVVYAVLAEQWRGRRSLMCMNGQPRLSAWLLLRLLKKDGVMVHYAGDFDPEGLCIAERVQQSLDPAQFSFWHMTEADYERAVSAKPIEARRLKMLDRLQDPMLQQTAAAIRQKGLAGYQENILSCYLED